MSNENDKMFGTLQKETDTEKISENLSGNNYNILEPDQRRICTEAVVKLYRLSEATIKRFLHGNASHSPYSENKTLQNGREKNRRSSRLKNHFGPDLPRSVSPASKTLPKDKDEKRLVLEMEKRLTAWCTRRRDRKNSGCMSEEKVIKKANQILKRLKGHANAKRKSVQFTATKEWLIGYESRTGCFYKPTLNSTVKRKYCNCGCRDFLLGYQPIQMSMPTSESSDQDDEEWCTQTKTELMKKTARDLEMDISIPSLELTGGNSSEEHVHKDATRMQQEKLDDNTNVTPVPTLDVVNKLNFPADCSVVDQKEISNISCEPTLNSEVTSTGVHTANTCVPQDSVAISEQENDDSDSPQIISVLSFPESKCIVSEHSQKLTVPSSIGINCENESVQCFRRKLEKIVTQENYVPQQIFNVHETILYWKKMPTKCSIIENKIGGLPESKDPLALLLGTNASGDCRLEPLLVYSVENPQPIKRIIKSSLPVIWKFHPRVKITASLFEDWFTYSFIPAVQVFCIENNIPFKILLILDTSPCHSRILEFAHPNVKVIFLSSDIAPVLQPMEQGITASFKANYLNRMLEMFMKTLELGDRVSLQSIWNSFNVLSALKLIKAAWSDVLVSSITSAWRAMSAISSPADFSVLNPGSNIVSFIIRYTKCLQLDITERDITNWMDYHSHELSNEELRALEKRSDNEDASSNKELSIATLTSKKLLEAFMYLDAAMKIFESEDPNFKRSSFVIDNIKQSYECYRAIYSEQKKSSSVNGLCSSMYDSMDVDEDLSSSNANLSSTDLKPPSSCLDCKIPSNNMDSFQGSL